MHENTSLTGHVAFWMKAGQDMFYHSRDSDVFMYKGLLKGPVPAGDIAAT